MTVTTNRWNLSELRQHAPHALAPHQELAFGRLFEWYKKAKSTPLAGGILALPTGAGKTNTATTFLAEGPLSDGYKVLWLAHTHHLLEQAFHCFRADRIGSIREPRSKLALRVVSGTPGHFPPRDISTEDDVVIGTLQTVANAVQADLAAMSRFIRAAGKKLFIIFDEAHHAPAPSYRKLLQGLMAHGASALGLTATPVYGDESKQGWLKKLFPSGIIAQALTSELMAAGVLARPHAVPIKTNITPSFDERDYQKWLGTFRDIPDDVVDALATNADRNAFIAGTYADNRKKFGKTIIFTDRWFQCEAIAELLRKRGVRAGAVYSHVDAKVPAAKKRDADENARVLARFRKKELDVLVNVRMLTEGTDIPDAETVFITRQTTSRILLTQMVGRAMRGPKFGGTADAYIVSFEDDWRQQIQWAGFDLMDGGASETDGEPRHARPPIQLISIELVRRLAAQMSGGVNVASAPFQTHLPVGWYRTLFDARLPGEDDFEPADLLVMVYEDERAGFERLVAHLVAAPPMTLEDESVTLEAHRDIVSGWREKHLAGVRRNPTDLETEVFQIARHVAQRGSAPQFYDFEVRVLHDLDAIADDHIKRDIGARTVDMALRREFAREDRFWQTLFYRYEQFRHFYDGCVSRLLGGVGPEHPGPTTAGPVTPEVVTDEVKEEVRRRDRNVCLACGTSRKLEVDHIVPVYSGGTNEKANLQTLCKRCNVLKSKQTMSFRASGTSLSNAPAALPDTRLPGAADAANAESWERFLRRSINFFYRCAAVSEVAIGLKGAGYYNWTVTLASDNPSSWLAPKLPALFERIQKVREAAGKPRIVSLRLTAPGAKDVVIKDAAKATGSAKPPMLVTKGKHHHWV